MGCAVEKLESFYEAWMGAVEKLENFYEAHGWARQKNLRISTDPRNPLRQAVRYYTSQVINSSTENPSRLNFFHSQNVNSIETLHQKEPICRRLRP